MPQKHMRVWFQLGDTMNEVMVNIPPYVTIPALQRQIDYKILDEVFAAIVTEILKRDGSIERLHQIKFGEILDG